MQNYFDNEAISSALHATMKPARGGKCLVTLSTYEDRKEALLNTAIMDDAGTYRSKGPKMNTTQQSRHQNDTLDSRESKQETSSHIPKPPPPFQMTSTNSTYRNNNNTLTTATATNNTNKTFPMNDQISDQRSSNSSQNSNANVYNSNNDTYSRPNKTPATPNGLNINRQTLRLGTVTIGEYRQQTMRKEPEKFDFISTQKKGRDSGDTTPTNEALQSELQNTLSRANLRKSSGNSYTEHQRNCPLHQQQQQLQQRKSMDYGSNGYTMDEMSKKMQKSTLNENNTADQLLVKTNNRPLNNATGSTGAGILKNGNRSGTTSSNKSTEKSIKFG